MRVAVGAVVGAADERLALRHAAILHAVEVDVVIGRVGHAARQGRGDQAQELVLELVRGRVPGEQQVRLVCLDHVLEHRQVACGPVLALLDVGLLAGDAGLEDREVGGGGRREPLGEVLGEVGGRRVGGISRPARPGGDGATHGGVEQADLREVGREPLHLDQHASGLAGERPARDLDLHVGPLALGERAHGGAAVLRGGEQDLVVVDRVVVRAVEQVGVEAVLVDAEVEHPQAHLLGRAVRRRTLVQPVASVGAAAANGAWPAKPAGWSNWRPKEATKAALSAGDV